MEKFNKNTETKQCTIPSVSKRFFTGLVYTKPTAKGTEISLRIIGQSAVSEAEALGLAINHFRDEFKGYDLSVDATIKQDNNRFNDPLKMAEWMHNNYEEIALNNGWKTQENCQVPFCDLPKENKETMLELCDRFINGC